MLIAQHLNLHMLRLYDELLYVAGLVAKGRPRLALRPVKGLLKPRGLVHATHALATATGRSLDQHRKADCLGKHQRLCGRRNRMLRARHNRHARRDHPTTRRRLLAHRLDGRRWRSDEDHTRIGTGLCELRILRQEAIARVNRLSARQLRDLQNLVHPEVALAARRRPHAVGLIGVADMERTPVGLAVDRNCRDPHLLQRAHYANRDLSSIRDQDFLEHVPPCGDNLRPRCGYSALRQIVNEGCQGHA